MLETIKINFSIFITLLLANIEVCVHSKCQAIKPWLCPVLNPYKQACAFHCLI